MCRFRRGRSDRCLLGCSLQWQHLRKATVSRQRAAPTPPVQSVPDRGEHVGRPLPSACRDLSRTDPTGEKKALERRAAPFVEVAELAPRGTMVGVLAGHVPMRSCPQPHQMAGPRPRPPGSGRRARPPRPARDQTLLLCGDAGRPGRHMQAARQEQRNNSGGWWAGVNREAELKSSFLEGKAGKGSTRYIVAGPGSRAWLTLSWSPPGPGCSSNLSPSPSELSVFCPSPHPSASWRREKSLVPKTKNKNKAGLSCNPKGRLQTIPLGTCSSVATAGPPPVAPLTRTLRQHHLLLFPQVGRGRRPEAPVSWE